MGKFKFKKQEKMKPLIIEIEENLFECFPETNNVKIACEKFSHAVLILNKEIEAPNLSKENLNDCFNKIYFLISEAVNQILGEGSYNKIFASRAVDFHEHQELICYILGEMKDYYDKNMVKVDEHIN